MTKHVMAVITRFRGRFPKRFLPFWPGERNTSVLSSVFQVIWERSSTAAENGPDDPSGSLFLDGTTFGTTLTKFARADDAFFASGESGRWRRADACL